MEENEPWGLYRKATLQILRNDYMHNDLHKDNGGKAVIHG